MSIADDTLAGMFCYFCGGLVGEGDAPGYPRYCSEKCKKDHDIPNADIPVVED